MYAVLLCKFFNIADAVGAIFVFVSSAYSLCTNSAEFNKATNMFRKRVFQLSHHDTTEAKMTSERKRAKSE